MDQITPEQIIAAYATRALVAESALRQAQAELDTLRTDAFSSTTVHVIVMQYAP